MRVPPPVDREPVGREPVDRHGDSGAETSTTSVARAEAGAVGQSAAEAGRGVAGTAAEQAGQVTEEARRQAEDLLALAREQISEQARDGQHKAGEAMRGFASELKQMADGADGSGPASQLAREAAHRVDGLARWLRRREPGEVLDEVRSLARRRPGTFLAGAALAGVAVGRLTRGAADAVRDESAAGEGSAPNGDREPQRDQVPQGDQLPQRDQETVRTDAVPLDGPEPDPGPSHGLRPGATTVGEYVEELERRGELDQPPMAGTS